MSEHAPDQRYALMCLCGEAWPCIADLEAENARLQADVKELEHHLEMDDPRLLESVELTASVRKGRDRYKALAEAHGCQDCAYEVGVPVPGPTGLCPKHADEQIDGRHSERRRRVKAEALAERRGEALEETHTALLSAILFIEGVFPEPRSEMLKQELTSYRIREVKARAALAATPSDVCGTCGGKRRAFGTCEYNVLPHPCKDAGPCPACAATPEDLTNG